MDPDANLARQLHLASVIQMNTEVPRVGSTESILHVAEELAELVLAMHEWRSNGGSLPKFWQK